MSSAALLDASLLLEVTFRCVLKTRDMRAPLTRSPPPRPLAFPLPRLPYATRWGENVVLVGEAAALGGGDVCRGPRLACLHEDNDALVWQARVRSAGWAGRRARNRSASLRGHAEDERALRPKTARLTPSPPPLPR